MHRFHSRDLLDFNGNVARSARRDPPATQGAGAGAGAGGLAGEGQSRTETLRERQRLPPVLAKLKENYTSWRTEDETETPLLAEVLSKDPAPLRKDDQIDSLSRLVDGPSAPSPDESSPKKRKTLQKNHEIFSLKTNNGPPTFSLSLANPFLEMRQRRQPSLAGVRYFFDQNLPGNPQSFWAERENRTFRL